ncbi:MAG TPA: hypothetical protein VE178_07620 [Silvibacterium sp.]|nr:hypothetical protein [Silvibacterium sp.]
MRKSLTKAVLFLLSFALFAAPALPQDSKSQEAAPAPKADANYYRLEFVLKEVGDDGRVVNSRTYYTDVATGGRSSQVRAGTKIPVRTNDKDEIQYLDLGVNIDCDSAHETPQGLGLHISAEISSIASPTSGEIASPVVRQNRWSSMTLIPLGKPTVVFSSDNLENKGRMQVEVTATPIH